MSPVARCKQLIGGLKLSDVDIIEGSLNGAGLRFGIVAARFNGFITESLLSGCLEGLRRHNADVSQVKIVKVPGAFEIPFAAEKLAASQNFDAIICLGAVIRGATPHFDYVCSACTSGISRVSEKTGIPAIFGVITTDTIEQALERAGTKSGNKGWDAAVAAIEMANLNRLL